MNLKESREGCMGGFGGRKEKGNVLELNYSLKDKINKNKN